jgi:hypothetical protein
MPQGPFQVQVLSNATKRTLNITANTVIKASNGNIATVSVVVAGTAAGSIHDAATVAAAVTANQVAALPATAGPLAINFPVTSGIVVKPGTGQTIAVSWT